MSTERHRRRRERRAASDPAAVAVDRLVRASLSRSEGVAFVAGAGSLEVRVRWRRDEFGLTSWRCDGCGPTAHPCPHGLTVIDELRRHVEAARS